MTRIVLACFGLTLVLASYPAGATQQGIQASKNWLTMDRCTRDAQAAFPDYTQEAYAKRDARMRACLAGQNLPPRAPIVPEAR